jgi:hypothetical protein
MYCRNGQASCGQSLYLYQYPSNVGPVTVIVYTTYEDGTGCSETWAHKIHTPGNQALDRVQKKEDKFANHTNDPGCESLAQRRKRFPLKFDKNNGYFT